MKLITLMLAAGISLFAQSKVTFLQLPTCPSANGTLRIWVGLPTNNGLTKLSCVGLDPASLAIDPVSGNLKVVFPAATTASTINFVNEETPAGTVDGVNATFTLAHTPVAGSLALHVAIRMKLGVDYTLVGNTVTFLAASIPQVGSVLVADYRY